MTDQRAVSDKTHETETPAKPKEQPPPRRPSYERVIENIEKWANSSGLQKPT
jgi:hypothetical protein